MKETEKNESKLLFDAISNVVFSADQKLDFSDVDIGKFYNEAKKQSISSVIFKALPKSIIEKEQQIYSDWFNRTMFLISRNTQIAHAHFQLGKVLEDANIKYCILKGIASSSYYPNSEIRDMGDVDFIIYPEDVDITCKVLEENGYVKSPVADEHPFHIAFSKNKIDYELHYRFTESEDSKDALEDTLTQEIIENSCDLCGDFGTVKSVSDKYHCLIMLLHMKRHMTSSGMGLRHLCDWAVFVDSFDSNRFVLKFKPTIEKYGLWRFAQVLSQVSYIYFNIEKKDWFGEPEIELCGNLMEYIFSTGNFGSKGTNFSNLFISNTDTVSSGKFIQVVSSVKKIVITHWPKSKTNILLLIVGFVYFPLKYIINIILGKRKKVNVINVLKSGSNINKTFKQLDLYKENKKD